jgi:putative transcriptional regulator
MNAMMRVRLKADGRIVEILADGSERGVAGTTTAGTAIAGGTDLTNPRTGGQGRDAVYAKGIRARVKLTQAEFAARIGVPIETVRNWEQGKRSPRGPARALLRVIEQAPEAAFAMLAKAR